MGLNRAFLGEHGQDHPAGMIALIPYQGAVGHRPFPE